MKLLRIFTVIEKYYPEVATPEIKAYCTEADAPEAERTGQFELGYNSLKWALCSVNDINPDAVKNVLRDILFEFYARKLPFQQIEINILTFAAMYPYKAQLKNRQTIDVSALPSFSIRPNPDSGLPSFLFIINETAQILTSKIFRETRADAIIFHTPDTHAAGIIFRVNSRLNILAGFKKYLYETLTLFELNNKLAWDTLGDDQNLIINHGNSSVTTYEIIQIIKNYNL